MRAGSGFWEEKISVGRGPPRPQLVPCPPAPGGDFESRGRLWGAGLPGGPEPSSWAVMVPQDLGLWAACSLPRSRTLGLYVHHSLFQRLGPETLLPPAFVLFSRAALAR